VSYQIQAAKANFQGDPGLFSVLGSIGKGIGKIAGKVLPILKTAIPAVGAAAGIFGIAKQIFTPAKGKTTSPPFVPFQPIPTLQQPVLQFDPTQGFQQQGPPPVMPGTGIQVQFPQGPFGMGGGGIQVGSFPRQPAYQPQQPQVAQPGQATGTQMCQLPSGGVAMRATHANKAGYFIRTGPTTGAYIPPGTRCVTNRRMNPLNPRALHKAMTRIVSAKRAASFLGRITVRSACKTSTRRRAAPRHGSGCRCATCK